jgi:hypothetical protein
MPAGQPTTGSTIGVDTPTPPATTLSPAALTALSGLLTVEHAAVYATASAGGALAPLGQPAEAARSLAYTAYTAHRELRDQLTGLILTAGGQPPAALPAYALPVSPDSVQGALTLLAELDDRTAAACYDTVQAVTGTTRQLVVDTLTQAAIRAQRARMTAGTSPASAMRAFPGHPS